ncbi:MAG: hypothetical protein EOS20_17490 [Mesorhizobium sp.]|uniref:hypothetical protein n=1 Tax=Mesorhizobium sp. TaxID=1871066 RepID=UPI000FE4B731|nr:hypothetical protein [Mesorhizobium sp.]RWQ35864.1 MAG: hypothetical protein EOS20_17490 [Mesorhizobium sp.]
MMMYLRIAALAVFLAVVALALWYRGNAIKAEAETRQAKADLATAIGVNDANDETIGRMKATAEAKDKLLAEIAGQIATINGAIAENTAAVEGLKDANEDVRAYLAGAIPPNLGLQLNK